MDMVADLSSSKAGLHRHGDYRKMQFCRVFNISPLEYDLLPSKLVKMWTHMYKLEAEMKNGVN